MKNLPPNSTHNEHPRHRHVGQLRAHARALKQDLELLLSETEIPLPGSVLHNLIHRDITRCNQILSAK